jgi:small ligand-binding sensory domain FIST
MHRGGLLASSQALIAFYPPTTMQWINALSTRPSLEAALNEVVETITASLNGSADLGVVFISSSYSSDYPRLMPLLAEKLPISVVIGCGGGGIIGMEQGQRVREIEGNLALSLTVAHLPGVTIHPVQVFAEQMPDLDSPPERWMELMGVDAAIEPHFLLLCDPFTSRINDLLEGLDFAYPSSLKVGGLASGTSGENGGTLFYQDTRQDVLPLQRQGVVGVALSGNITMEAIVAQGCRPIGQAYRVTQGERNVIMEMVEMADPARPRPPLTILQGLMQELNESDRELAQHSLFMGIARDEFKQQLGQGDFLIRNLLGVDPRHGAIAVGDRIRPGQRVQFHLRDAATSALDLQLLLDAYRSEKGSVEQVKGALLFSCLGRGEMLYNQPNFDSEMLRKYVPGIPVGGFFCNGEIGPVGGRTFLHGYTSAFALFRPKLAS